MKCIALAIALGATLAPPLTAAAETQSQQASPSPSRFLIVDARSGRTLATLVPVEGAAHEFRLIGSVSAQRASVAPVVETAPAFLTPGQLAAAAQLQADRTIDLDPAIVHAP